MIFHSSTKRTVGERVLSGALALTLGVSCVATNFFGLAPKDKASVAFAAPVEYTDVIRSSYTGDYQPGVTYYDFGELKGRAYYDNGWKSTGNDDTYRRNGWQIRDVHSFLDDNNDGHLDADTTKVANTLPYTTDLNSTVNDTDSVHQKELMCWQAYVTDEAARTRYLERTDVPDFASPPYGDSVEAYYIAKGDVAQDAVTGEITITWSIRSWPKDSEGWIDPDTFSKTGLTGLSGAITENGVDNTNLDDEFISYFNTHDEVDDLWNKADFSAKSLWFGDSIDTWWDGVAAAIYQADVTYTGRQKSNAADDYDAHITINNVNRADGTVTGAAIAGTIDCDYGDAAYPTFGHVLQGQGYGAARDLLMGSITWDAADTHDLRDYLDGTNSGVKAVRLLDTEFASISDPSVTTTDAIIGLSLNRIAELYPAGLQHVGTEWQVKGEQMNEWKISGQLTDEAAALNYNDDEWYTFVDDTNITNGNHGGISSIKNTTSYVSIIKNLVKDGGAQWIFDMSDDEIVDTLCAAGYTPNATERAAIIALVRDVEMDYDPEEGQLWVNNLAYDGANNALGYAKYAISLPLVGFVGTLANYADTNNTIREKMYITTGYQRAAGEVVAKRVDSEINTNATTPDGIGGNTSTGYAITGAQIVDAVTCNNLVPGKKYRLVGAIYAGGSGDAGKAYSKTDKAFSGPVDVISYNPSAADLGNYVITVEDFTATAATETVDMTYNYDATGLVGSDVVVCARLYDNDNAAHEIVAEHVDKDNTNQTITIKGKSATSEAVDAADDDKNVYTTTNVSIKDTISYVGLNPGTDYEVVPYYNIFDADGNKVGSTIVVGSALKEFTTTTHYGDVVVTISNIDTSALDAGSTIVMGQKIYEKGGYAANSAAVIDHYVTDGTQTVTVTGADLATTATAYDGKSSSIKCDSSVIILDAIAYTGLINGQTYTLKTSIYDKTANKWYNNVTTDTPTFVADATGKVDVQITFDTTALKGHELVLAEEVYLGTTLIASHKDVNDVNQTVTVETPSIRTVATTDGTSKTVDVLGNAQIIDTVSYSNLTKNGSYKLVGSIYDVDAKEYVVQNVAETFTASDVNGTASVTFTGLNVVSRQGHKLVVEEILYLVSGGTDTEIARHTDRTDVDQTVTVKTPSMSTKATNASGTKIIDKASNAVIVDEVTYKNLAVGVEYTLEASLVDVKANKVLHKYTETFTPTKSDDVKSMSMTLDTTGLDGKSINVEQRLYIGTDLILTHIDPSAAQTVSVNAPVIQTYAGKTTDETADGNKMISCSYESAFVDEVSYAGLVPGKDYILVTKMYDGTAYEADGSAIQIGDSVATKFTAAAESGEEVVDLKVDATGLIGHVIVVTEELYEDNGGSTGKKIAEHSDLTDYYQSVKVEKPEIHTVATGVGMGKNIASLDKVTISDKVMVKNFPTTGTYTVITGLYDRTAKKYINEAIKTTQIDASKITDSFTIEFDVDTTNLANHELVVYQTIKHDLTNIVEHTDSTDDDQTVKVVGPTLKTVAVDKSSKTKNLILSKDAVIIDTVSYTNLYPGETYTLSAAVYDKSTDSMVAVKSSDFDFTPTSSDGKVDVEITIDSTAIPSDTLVVFEYLMVNGKTVASHVDKNDADQTVTVGVPGIKTVALDSISGKHTGTSSKKSVVKDTVTYTGLTAGTEYTLEADIYDAASGNKISSKSVSHKFTPSASNGSEVVSIEVNTSDFDNKSIVVYERLYLNGKLIAVHEDINDANQTVTYTKPSIRTVATNKTYDSKNIVCAKSAVVVDKLYYSNFVAGRTYSVEAYIVDLSDNNKVIATKNTSFTAGSESGEIAIEFNVDTTERKGHTFVVCENVETMLSTSNEGTIDETGAFTVSHVDLKDADQTIYVDIPKIRTNASSKATGNHTVEKAEKAVIVDRVTYSGLVIGEKYSVTATPYNKATGKPIEGINPVTVEFKAEHTDGYIDVELEVDATKLSGMTIVMFESLKYNDIEIAVHNDIDDEEQTVYVMSVKTKATAADKESKILPQNADVKVIDKVTYTGLTVGETYVLTGKLVDKDDPTKVIDEQTLEFVPIKPDGDVEITFEMNTTGKEHKSFVAFETVTQKSNGKVIGEHKDLTDADQTVTVLSPPPKTGDDSPVLFLTLAMILSFGGFIAVFTFARKRRRTE